MGSGSRPCPRRYNGDGPNVLALILLPLFGVCLGQMQLLNSESVRRLYCSWALPRQRSGYDDNCRSGLTGVNFNMFIVALGLALVAMGTYRSPAVALMPDLTPPALRSKANAIINLMGVLGGVYTLGFISLLVKEGGEVYTDIRPCRRTDGGIGFNIDTYGK